MNKLKTIIILLGVCVAGGLYAQQDTLRKQPPIILSEQGSFMAGGSVVTHPGNYTDPRNPEGQTLHGDHAYVFYQKPVDARRYPLVFLHGIYQFSKTWETTPDGREGFQNIFLRRGFSTYNVTGDMPGAAPLRPPSRPASTSSYGSTVSVSGYGRTISRGCRCPRTAAHWSSSSVR